MIWHIYDNNEKAMERVIIKEEQPHLNYRSSLRPSPPHKAAQAQQRQEQKQYPSSLSSAEDIVMQTDDDEEHDYSAGEESDTNTNYTASTQKITKAKPINNQPLFLNFTSDLNPHQPNKSKKRKAAAAAAAAATAGSLTNTMNQTSYKVNGVNILNRKNLDSKTVIERIQKRRENHNCVERRRRDCINNTILELSHIVPNASLPGQNLNKGDVLKLALDYILYIQAENTSIKNQLNQLLDSRESALHQQQQQQQNSTAASQNLIGNTSSYQGYNEIRPMLRSSPSTIIHITSPPPQHNSDQKQPLLRPILPVINSNHNNISAAADVVPPPPLNSLPIVSQQQPPQHQHRYSPANQNYNRLPPPPPPPPPAYNSPFIYSESYYKNTCRFL